MSNDNKKNYEQINMIDYIHSNGKINTIIDNNNISKEHHKVIKIENNQETIKNEEKEENISQDNIIDLDEYEDLCLRFAQGDSLTKDELISLKKATIYYSKNENMTLKPKNNGYANEYFIIYIIMVIVFLTLAISSLLFGVK